MSDESQLKLYVAQMTSVDSVDINLQKMLKIVDEIGPQKLHTIVSFPENCLFMRLRPTASIPPLHCEDPAFSKLAAKAKEYRLHLHLGSAPISRPDERNRLTNSTVWIDASGKVEVVYEKLHLFDITLNDGLTMKESDAFVPGGSPSILELGGWKMGLSICYDLRFSNLYQSYAELGCQLLFVPAAFLVQTGRAHWEVLLRARAIESQAYVIASAQAGLHLNAAGDRRETFGHSMIISPWGEVLKVAGATQEVVFSAVLNLDSIEQVRRQIPMKDHRRKIEQFQLRKLS